MVHLANPEDFRSDSQVLLALSQLTSWPVELLLMLLTRLYSEQLSGQPSFEIEPLPRIVTGAGFSRMSSNISWNRIPRSLYLDGSQPNSSGSA